MRLPALIVALALAAVNPVVAAPAAPPSPAASTPSAASLTQAAKALDTWQMSAGSSAGWAPGDHVRIVRGGKPVAEAVVMEVGPKGATLVVTKRSGEPKRGDGVEFMRHKSLPSTEPPPTSGVSTPGVRSLPAAAGGIRSLPSAGGGAGDPGQTPTDWKTTGSITGLLGDDWMEKDTRYTHVYARKGDIKYLGEVVDLLDTSYDVNHTFMGVSPRIPMQFYFFSLDAPAHTQPKFKSRLASKTRAAGVALGGSSDVVVNLGNWRTSSHYEPWDVEEICRHEMNHLFMYRVRGSDRTSTWHWFAEALAHTIEDTVKPVSSRVTLAEIKTYMQGYKSRDASWQALIGDRDNDELEQYRDYRKLLVSVVFFLQEKHGSDVVRRLMLSAGQGKDIEDAFVEVTGKSTKDLETEWKAYYGIH